MYIKISEIKEKPKRYRLILFIYVVSYLTVSMGFDIILTAFIGRNVIDSFVTYGILAALVFFGYMNQGLQLKVDVRFLITICIVLALFLFDRFLPLYNGSTNKMILSQFAERSIIGIFAGYILYKSDDIYTCLRGVAFANFAFSFFIPFIPYSTLFLYTNDAEGNGASMLFGQHMLPAVLIFLYLFMKENDKRCGVFGIIGALEIVILGNRGSAICLAIFLLAYILLYTRGKRAKAVIIIAAAFAAYLFITSSFGIQIITQFLSRFGISSRNLTKLADGTLGESGRDYIYEFYRNMAKEHWFAGVGISHSWVDGYPHNIFLEVLCQYGYILGGILIAVFAIKSLKILLNKTDKTIGEIYLIFLVNGFGPLLFSGSYLTYPWFWTMLGIMFVFSKEIKNRRLNGV